MDEAERLVKAVGFFFFSSRRRHTRYIGDWSSDVCSSDLIAEWGVEATRRALEIGVEAVALVRHLITTEGIACDATANGYVQVAHRPERVADLRSEERRVGKGGRSWRSPEY